MKMGTKIRMFIVKLLKILKVIALRCWTVAGAAVLICIFIYWIYGGILAFLLLCFATTGILYQSEDMLLYHPDLPAHSRVFVPVPSMFGLQYENVYVHSNDGTLLHMFFIRQKGELATRAPTIVFLHGNAGNMGHRMQNVVGMYQQLECNILMLEYRGYGLSQGTPNEEGLSMDAQSALDFLSTRADINHKEIIVFGRSLGGAVATDLTSRPEYSEKIWCLILENTFTSIPDMARVIIGWKFLQYLPLCFYKNKYMSLWKMGSISVPCLFISGLADTLVPPRMMTDLHERCASLNKKLIQFPTGTHNETWSSPGYYHTIATFLRDTRLRQLSTAENRTS